MKVNSISGVLCYANDLDRTQQFYEALGFRIGKREPGRLTCYVNWFWLTFASQDDEDDPELREEANMSGRGTGLLVYVKVDDLDDYYENVLALGLKPASEPKVRAGNREFVLHDPDGYRLVFFEKK